MRKLNSLKTLGILSIVIILIMPPNLANAEENFIDQSPQNESVESDTKELINQDKKSGSIEEPDINQFNEEELIAPETDVNIEEKPIENSNEIKIIEDSSVNNIQSIVELKIGDSNSRVKELKQKLALLGFKVSNNPNNNFGPSTEQKVKEFQKYYGLKESGIANQETLNKIDKILASPFRNGQSHESVIQLKKDLEKLGFKVSNNPNTKYGPSTTRKVEEFQSFYSLVVNGIADEVTFKKINSLLNTPMKRGDYRQDAIYLKERLAKLGFIVSANPTPAYGPSTEKVVKEFQKYYGLNQSGIADSATMNKIDNLLKQSMQRGSKNNNVQKMKNDLAELGFAVSANPNTVFGPSTEKTVKDFQRYYKLRVTGVVEERTLAKIKEILDSPYRNGQSHESVIQLKKDLEKLGFKVSNNPNSKYGPSTTKKVEEFQSFYGLVVNGIADEITLAKMDELFNTPMKRGDYRQDAIYLKERLAELGFVVSANPTPAYGPSTEQTVKEFQKYYGLTQSGVADKATVDKIDYLLVHALRRGISNNDVQEMKENLAKIGFVVSANPNTVFGPSTEKIVKEFQQYYKLRVTGVAEERTLAKIKEILSSPFRNGGKGESVRELKMKLERLGFKVSDNPNENYGPETEKRVREFQQYFGLRVNGIGDPITLAKINDILTNAMQRGTEHKDVIKLKEDLAELGFVISKKPNKNYGPSTESKVREFQDTYNLVVNGIADEVTLRKIKQLLKGLNYISYNLTLKEAIEIQMKVSPQTDKREYAWVSKSYIDKDNRVTASSLNVRTQPSTIESKENVILGTLSKGTKVDIIDELGNWYAINYSSTGYHWFHAVEKDVRYYLNPKNFVNDPRLRFQFLDLSNPSGAPRLVLDNYLKDKGVLKNQGQAFIDAARLHGVNDIYLLSHALLETGNGTSTLAEGVRVGLNAKGEPKRVTDSNEKSLTKIKTVYNVYGIGAVDSNPLNGGSIRAYTEGWDTVTKAIIGGAAFIGGDYIKAGQNTLYKMRWNPSAMANLGYASHQYATDVGWAAKQVSNMYNLYKEIGYDTPILDIPVYK